MLLMILFDVTLDNDHITSVLLYEISLKWIYKNSVFTQKVHKVGLITFYQKSTESFDDITSHLLTV